MYFTQLPDHTAPGFDEQAHFNRFKQQNIIFNAYSPQSYCPNHVGCLSIKTILKGEEWYGIDNRRVAIRPGQFLILNEDQPYSCQIQHGEGARVLSVFFEKNFAAEVFHDMVHTEGQLLDHKAPTNARSPEFFQTLHHVDLAIHARLACLINELNAQGYDRWRTDEHLIFLLRDLIYTHQNDIRLTQQVNAVKPSTKKELFKRLCIAKDILHSDFQNPVDLAAISKAACLSRPQLIRQFRSVFQQTPHQYLVAIRLQHAAEQLKSSAISTGELAWQCGFNDASAFCRAFRTAYGLSPERYRSSTHGSNATRNTSP